MGSFNTKIHAEEIVKKIEELETLEDRQYAKTFNKIDLDEPTNVSEDEKINCIRK